MHAIEIKTVCTLVNGEVHDEDDSFPTDNAERVAYRRAALPDSWFALSSETNRGGEEGFIKIEPGLRHPKELQDCEDGGVRQGRPKPLEVRADHRVSAVQCGVEIAFSRHDVQELLLDFRWCHVSSLFSLSLWNIIIIVKIGVARLVLKLCEEEVVTPSGITDALDGRCTIVTTELLLPLFSEFGIRRLWTSPSFAVKNVTEELLEFDLPGDTDVVEEKGVDDFRICECPG